MQIPRPHYASFITDLRNLKNNKEFDERYLAEQSAEAGILLADKLCCIFDNKSYYYQIKKSVAIENGIYTVNLEKSIIERYKESEENPFEDKDYDFTKEDTLWNLLIDVFGDVGKYNNEDSKDAFTSRFSFYGFEVQSISENKEHQAFEMKFKILEQLPKMPTGGNEDNCNFDARDLELTEEEQEYERMQNYFEFWMNNLLECWRKYGK